MPPADRRFGALPGVPVGTLFPDRVALSRAGVHRPTQPGICGSDDGEGAESIVLSGGYGDDVFLDDRIVYTGQGGRDPARNAQVAHQPWNGYNAAMARSTLTGRPVRVARLVAGAGRRAYRYEGLYRVVRYWKDRGQDGFLVWKFDLVRLAPHEAAPWGETWTQPREIPPPPDAPESGHYPTDLPAPSPVSEPLRRESTVQQLVRDTATAQRLKRMHRFVCQMCHDRLDTPAGPYAEGAHIRPLGRPHDGPDVLENMLCLCPNCHVRFDTGAVSVWDDGRLIGAPGRLRAAAGHAPAPSHLAYHRAHFFNARPAAPWTDPPVDTPADTMADLPDDLPAGADAPPPHRR